MRNRPEYDMKVIGENLRRLRIANNLTVEEVRQYLRLGSPQAVYKHEEGKCFPQTDTMFALMELYGADLSDITRNSKEDEKSSSVFLRIFQHTHCPPLTFSHCPPLTFSLF